jgi:hypothetical protein
MMFSSISVVAWLCWIVALGLRGVEAQEGGDGSVSSADANANFGGGGGKFGNGDNNGGRRFGHKSVSFGSLTLALSLKFTYILLGLPKRRSLWQWEKRWAAR